MQDQVKEIKAIAQETLASVSHLKEMQWMPAKEANQVIRNCKKIIQEEDGDTVIDLSLKHIGDLAINWDMFYNPLHGESLEETLQILMGV